MPKKLTGAPRWFALAALAVAVGLTTWMFLWTVLWSPAAIPAK